MAFLTTADIASELESGYDSSQVDRLLLSAEASLRSVGFVFDDPNLSKEENQRLRKERFKQSMIDDYNTYAEQCEKQGKPYTKIDDWSHLD
jgi:hypothetical protein